MELVVPKIINRIYPPILTNYPSGLILFYDFQDKGDTIYDHSGNGHHGTLSGATGGLPILTTGINGYSRLFDATDDALSYTSDIIGTGDVTMSFWVYITGTGGGGFGRFIDNGAMRLYMAATDQITFTSNYSTNITYLASSTLLNRWVNVVVTRKAGGLATIYVNNVPGTEASSGTPGAPSAFKIGNAAAATNRAFGGYIADIKIWNRILSAVEIGKLYKNEAWRYGLKA